MAKAKSKKSVGIKENPLGWLKDKINSYIDKGSVADKTINRKEHLDKALKDAGG